MLKILPDSVGIQVSNIVQSTDIDQHPLFICLSFQNAKIVVSSVIRGVSCEKEMLSKLQKARNIFDTQVEMPLHIDGLLEPVSRESTTFLDLVNMLQLKSEDIIHINEIHHILQTQQYLACKEKIDSLVGHHFTERILFHGCSHDAALQIVNRGFDPDLIGLHGNTSLD